MSSDVGTITFMQTILDGPSQNLNRRIPVKIITEDKLSSNPDHLSTFDHALPIGISPGYSEQGRINSLALADERNGLIIEFHTNSKKFNNKKDRGPSPKHDLSGRKLLEEKILCRDVSSLFAFDVAPVSMSLHFDLKLRIINAVDIQSAFSAVDRKPISAIKAALGDSGAIKVKTENVSKIFRYPVYDPEDRNCKMELVSRAWVSQFLATDGNGGEIFEKVAKVDTRKFDITTLDMIAKITTDAHRLDHAKPLQTKHRLGAVGRAPDGQSQVDAASYKHKFRGEPKYARVQVQGPRGEYFTHAMVAPINGRSAALHTQQVAHINGKDIKAVESIGRDDPTTAEAQRAATVLRILQGSRDLLEDNPWIQNIWFPTDSDAELVWPQDWLKPVLQPKGSQDLQTYDIPSLNPSQQHAVNSMCSQADAHHLVVIQGPPGTGKTSVISAYVLFALNMGFKGIWLVAQSNVAVKNIAEKLIKVNFRKWKLLVSKEFHTGWHEHLYGAVQNNTILSENFKFINKKDLIDCQVILCTLSMLSNQALKTFTRHIPLNAMIVDEASQIEVGNYISIFNSFSSTLRKVCFVGDDKQLPPFGQEDLQDLQSIFEIPHLRKHVHFLDTQYRMPPQIGEIISKAVYDGKLNSNPLHPITNKDIACYFIDAAGTESQSGKSWKNDVEQAIVLTLAQHLQEAGKNYKIITPYDLQTTNIEHTMQNQGLDWEDKCFNVDAYQGNEEDFIIISLVRSQKLGFLANLRRTNVMLTRCKKGMYIVTSRKFLTGPGANCLAGELMGQMEEAIGDQVWLTVKDVEAGKIEAER